MKPILAIIVLYKTTLADSATFRTLQSALERNPTATGLIDLLVVDNSPEPQGTAATAPVDDKLPFRYVHDGTNPGLARRYNEALASAAARGCTWLMLLDQDTTLYPAYLAQVEALTASLQDDHAIVGLLPRLVAGGRLLSPHLPAYRISSYQLDSGVQGVPGGLLRAFNSGAVLRVSALQAIGGFPEQYWLDYLDHATFHRLQAGYRLQPASRFYVMDVSLEHDMSIHRPEKHRDPANAARHRNQLAAALRFYREHGTHSERIRQRIDLFSLAWGSLRQARFAEFGRHLEAAVSRSPGRDDEP